MKHLVIILSFLAIAPACWSQIGIGIVQVDVSAILEIGSENQGVLLPILSTAQRNAIPNPAKGLMIYNSSLNQLDFNSGNASSPNWSSIATQTTNTSKLKQSAKFSNTDNSTNINSSPASELPIYGQEEWNDNTSLYVVSGNSLVISESGRYHIIVNVSLQSTSNAGRKAPEIYLTINGTQSGSFGSTGYMRRATGHEASSIHLNEVINLSAGDIIAIEIQRAGNSNTVTMRASGSSNFYIEKLN